MIEKRRGAVAIRMAATFTVLFMVVIGMARGQEVRSDADNPAQDLSTEPSSRADPRLQRLGHKLREACDSDIQRFCSDLPAVSARVTRCLRRYDPQLLPSCREQLRRLRTEEQFGADPQPR